MINILASNVTSSNVLQLFSELDDFFIDFLGNDSHFYSRYNINENLNDVWIAYYNDMPVGCIAYRIKSSGVGEAKRLFVKNDYRGKGISKLLLVTVEKHSKSQGDNILHLSTRITLEPAINLYRNSGYIETYRNGLYVELEKRL